MPGPPTPRMQLPIPAETDPADVPIDIGKLANAIDPNTVMFGQSVALGSRPAAGTKGRLWVSQPGQAASPALGGNALSYDDGNNWTYVGSSVPVLTVPATGSLPTTALPKTGDCDDGQMIVVAIPAFPKGAPFNQPTAAANWHLRLYKSLGAWIPVGSGPLRSDVSGIGLSLPVSAGATATSTTLPRVLIPLAGAYEYDALVRFSMGATSSYVTGYVQTNDGTTKSLYVYSAETLAATNIAQLTGRRMLSTGGNTTGTNVDLGFGCGVTQNIAIADATVAIYPRSIIANA